MIKLEDIDLNKTKVDPEEIKKFGSEGEFMNLAVELLKELGTLSAICSCTYKLDEENKPRKWTRNEAIVGGLMVRLNKLQIGFLDQICQKRLEIAMIIFRCIAETLINIRYLLEKNSDELADKFIEYSLREEKRLLNKINKNIGMRGSELPIEKRMKKSILRSFKTSDFKLEDVKEERFDSWEKTIRERAKRVGMIEIYSALFSLPSHDVHGNWQDLISNHLEFENGEFSPNTNWKMPRPQPIFAICVLSAEINKIYMEKMMPSCPDRNKIISLLSDVYSRARLADKLHEEFLQRDSAN